MQTGSTNNCISQIFIVLAGTVFVPPLHWWYSACSTISHGGTGTAHTAKVHCNGAASIKNLKNQWRGKHFAAPTLSTVIIGLEWAETETELFEDGGQIKREKDIYHHGSNHIPIIYHLPDPPSLPTTFNFNTPNRSMKLELVSVFRFLRIGIRNQLYVTWNKQLKKKSVHLATLCNRFEKGSKPFRRVLTEDLDSEIPRKMRTYAGKHENRYRNIDKSRKLNGIWGWKWKHFASVLSLSLYRKNTSWFLSVGISQGGEVHYFQIRSFYCQWRT